MQGGAEGDLAPIGQSHLRGKDVKIEVDSRRAQSNKSDQRTATEPAHDPLALLHRLSVSKIVIKVYEYVLTRRRQNGRFARAPTSNGWS